MDLEKIKNHWEKLADKHAVDLKSTTKTPTIKLLEINAIFNAIKSISTSRSEYNVLEVGCGNGHNLFGLSKLLKNHHFTGVDYSSKMISNAIEINKSEKIKNVAFFEGDVLELDKNTQINKEYDVVFTDRCLINLNTLELQKKGFEQLSKKVKNGGHIIIIENNTNTYNNQNFCRESIGLAKRKPDEYNLFIDEEKFLDFGESKLELKLLETNDFGSLHDIMLYVLIPKINEGKVDYAHPLMGAVTELSIASSLDFKNSFGSFGQNRLYLFKKQE